MTGRTDGTALPPFEAEVARAWNTPGRARYHLPETDVNKVLAARYTTSAPLTLTRTTLWDMEARKAACPAPTSRTQCKPAATAPGTATTATAASTWTAARCSGCGSPRTGTR